MSCREEAAIALRSTGRRVTSARLAVIEALRHSGGHMTPAGVIEAARHELPRVDPSTVYRTLGELRDAGLVSETTLGYGESFYEWSGSTRHHHLRCGECGAVSKLSDVIVDSLRSSVRADHGFDLKLEHLVLDGRCGRCSGQSDNRNKKST